MIMMWFVGVRLWRILKIILRIGFDFNSNKEGYLRVFCRIDVISLLCYESYFEIRLANLFRVLCYYKGSR